MVYYICIVGYLDGNMIRTIKLLICIRNYNLNRRIEMCIPSDPKSDYINMINSSAEFKTWLRNRFQTVDDLYSKLTEVELKKYQELHKDASRYTQAEELISDVNKDEKIYEILLTIGKESTMKQRFRESLKNVQEHDRKGYAYDENLLRKYSYTYFKNLDLRVEINSKMEKAIHGYKPNTYKLSIADKCYKSFEYMETSAKILATKDTSSISDFDFSFPGGTVKDLEEKLKIVKALAILNERYKRDISSADDEIARIEKRTGYTLEDDAEIIYREIKYIKAALVDMMTLGEKLRHSFSADGEFDFDFDL